MTVYPANKFLNGLKRDLKRPKTIRAPGRPSTSKTEETLKKLTKSWKIHQDNAPDHFALAVKSFFAKYGITMLEQVWKRLKQKRRRF
ncbi:hypothetical protein NQ318_017862 [Aromia moschata]|uniref:Transposase n=1 Tax=Aromia moschata TaxID=1265417 RepID=A0AAV8XRW0_9CUCU|nr:hypothetical protein NQ318_017862 [Aromia moschata]